MTTFNLDWQVDTSQIEKLVTQLQATKDKAEAAAAAMGGVESNVKKASQATHEFSLQNTGVIRELSVMMGEALRGNWTRLEQSMTVLANRTGLLAMVFSPLGASIAAVVGAVGLLAVGARQGAEEQHKLEVALTLSGNAAGSTAGRLIDAGRAAGEASGNLSGAKEAITKLAESGRFSEAQIQSFGTTAAEVSRVTGENVDKVAQKFIQLADRPMQAVMELNKQYHFLTAAVVEHIAALERQGRTDEAAAVAAQAYSDAMKRRSDEVVQNLGYMARAANATGEAFKWMWDKVQSIGRPDTIKEQLANAEAAVKALNSVQHPTAQTEQRLQAATALRDALVAQMHDDQKLASKDADKQAKDDGASRARAWWEGHHKEFLTQAQRYKEEEDRIVKEGREAGVSEADINQAVANYRSTHKVRQDPARNSENNREIEAFRGDIERKRVLYETDVINLETSLKRGEITQQQFDDRKLSMQIDMLSAQEKDAEEAAKISAKKGKNFEAERQRWLDTANKYKAEMDKARAEREKAETDHANKIKATWESTAASLDRSTQAQLLSMRKQTRQLYETNNERAVEDRHDTTNVRFDEAKDKLIEKMTAERASAEELQKALDDLETKRMQALGQEDAEWQKRLDAQHDWTNGARQAFKQYVEDAQNAAEQTKGLFTNAFQKMEDSLVNFATTGKFNFADLAKSIIADIIRMEVKAAESKVLSYLGEAFGFGGGGGGVPPNPFAQAAGGVWSKGVRMFATGEVVGGPRFFNNGAGLMGEQGPEAIMPLTRGADGKLGVVAQGSSGQGVTVHGGINVSVQGGMTNEDTGKVVALAVAESLKRMPAVADSRIHNAQRYGGLSYGK